MSLANGKELLQKSIKSLNDRQTGEAGGNRASCPVVIIFMGEKSAAHKEVVKSTLESNWINARYLQYITVKKSEDGWIGEYAEESREIAQASFEDALNGAIGRMLAQDQKIFKDRNSIKLDFILDATEEDAKEYFQLYMTTTSKSNASVLKSMFLMLDQDMTGGIVEKSEDTLQHALKKVKDTNTTVYLVSNLTKGNYMLNVANVWKNYRLVADVILLSGNCKAEERSHFYNSVKTLAYTMVTKPIDEIAYVSLRTFLSKVYEIEEKQCQEKDFSDKKVQEKIHLAANGEYRFARDLFEEHIEKTLPKADAIRFLPFGSLEDLKYAQRGKVNDSKELNRLTNNAWNTYVKKHYQKNVDVFLESASGMDKCEKQIRSTLSESFDFFEYLLMAQDPLLVDRVFKETFRYTGAGAEGWRKFHNMAVFECKQAFYNKISQMLYDQLQVNIENAKRLNDYYKQVRKEVNNEHIPADEENYGNLEQVYTNIVMQYIQNKQNPTEVQNEFFDIFNVENTKAEMVTAIWKEMEYVFAEKTYSLDFERELDMRIKDMENNENVHAFVTNTLQKSADDNIRLRNCIDINSVFVKSGSYYLINPEAEYAKFLENQQGNGTEYVLFGLNRTDCVEQVEIWNITQTDNIHLIMPEKKAAPKSKRSSS